MVSSASRVLRSVIPHNNIFGLRKIINSTTLELLWLLSDDALQSITRPVAGLLPVVAILVPKNHAMLYRFQLIHQMAILT